MQIIEIEEPGKSDLQEEIVVGIDFGTTNSLIAYSKHNKPQIINSVGKNGLLPSVIFYDDRLEKFVIGKNRGEKNSISSIKRLLSKSYEEIKSTEVLHKILSDFVSSRSYFIYAESYIWHYEV
jgi:molecular chaperone HscA